MNNPQQHIQPPQQPPGEQPSQPSPPQPGQMMNQPAQPTQYTVPQQQTEGFIPAQGDHGSGHGSGYSLHSIPGLPPGVKPVQPPSQHQLNVYNQQPSQQPSSVASSPPVQHRNPSLDAQQPQLGAPQPGQMMQQQTQFEPTDENQVTVFAATNFRNELRRFGIRVDDRRRHMYVIGKTGMGKSTMLENMIIQDIQNGNGLAVVDPHGDLVEKVLDFIPSNRMNDVIYFNPSDLEYPIAFNILENVNPEYKNLVTNGLVGVFKKIWADSWGPRLEYILTNAILGLIEYPGSTLLGVTRMLVDSKYRKKVVRNITDPVVKSFWIDEYNNYSEKFRNEAIAPIQNKVGQFLSSSLIRNIVGQSKSTIEMREIMDSKKILLMNLSKGRIGEENAALLGAMMITKIQLAAMSRVDILERTRLDFYLYVDEFQNFATESFANILSEARKYRLNLIMAHQYVEQLSDEVRAAVFGNIGTLVAFRVGSIDAEELEKEFQPTFMQEDIVTLPSFNIYLRLMINGVASDPFSAVTLPPIEGRTENRDTVIRLSRERYGHDRAAIEEKILRWAGYISPNQGEEEDDDDEQDESDRQSQKNRNTKGNKRYDSNQKRSGKGRGEYKKKDDVRRDKKDHVSPRKPDIRQTREEPQHIPDDVVPKPPAKQYSAPAAQQPEQQPTQQPEQQAQQASQVNMSLPPQYVAASLPSTQQRTPSTEPPSPVLKEQDQENAQHMPPSDSNVQAQRDQSAQRKKRRRRRKRKKPSEYTQRADNSSLQSKPEERNLKGSSRPNTNIPQRQREQQKQDQSNTPSGEAPPNKQSSKQLPPQPIQPGQHIQF